MKATPLILLGLVLAGVPVASAQTPAVPPASADEKLIRGVAEAFSQAFAKGDAKAVAALFTATGEAIDIDGAAIRGRAALEAHYTERFQTNPGEKIKTEIELVDFLAPELARQDGRSTIVAADGTQAIASKYTATLVKTQGTWLIASIRELEDPAITPHDRLKELDWLVGDWIEETSDAVINTSIQWTEDKNFLIRSYDIRVAGKSHLKGTQRIGWDPLTRQIKSWVFDSRGGHGEGYWSRNGDQWVIKSRGVHTDGTTTSATQTLSWLNKDQLLWKSTDRTLGGETRDDIQEFMMVRKPPEPK